MPRKNLGNPIRYKTFAQVTDGFVGNVEKALVGKKLVPIFESKSADSERKSYRFIGTSEAKDRDGEIARLDSWDFSNYVNNPVVLWGHDSKSLPIGKTVGIYKDEVNRAIYFDIELTEGYDFAKSVKTLVEEGILRATSVGFRVLEWDYDEKADAIAFTKSELFEISIVNVPANQDALVQEGKELEETETKTKEADYADVITQIEERLERLTQSVESLISQSSTKAPEEPKEDEIAEVGDPIDSVPETSEEPDEENLEIPKTSDDISDELIERVTQLVLDKLQPKQEEPAETEDGEPAEDEEEDSAATVEPETEPEGAAAEEEDFIAVSVEDIDETDGFVIITEEEN